MWNKETTRISLFYCHSYTEKHNEVIFEVKCLTTETHFKEPIPFVNPDTAKAHLIHGLIKQVLLTLPWVKRTHEASVFKLLVGRFNPRAAGMLRICARAETREQKFNITNMTWVQLFYFSFLAKRQQRYKQLQQFWSAVKKQKCMLLCSS